MPEIEETSYSEQHARNADRILRVTNLTFCAGERVILHDLNFEVRRSDVFMIMGPSGCGKSLLMRILLGLSEPLAGEIIYLGHNFTKADTRGRREILGRVGALFQSPALFSSVTLIDNVALPLQQFTPLKPSEIFEVASIKLALVGLKGYESYFPSEISGGMQKRAGLARALALDPEVLLLDEPSAGLDPLSSRLLDDLILELRDDLGTTCIVVSHELPSILTIGNNSILLDSDARTAVAAGNPAKLLSSSKDPRVQRFLRRGEWQTAA